MIRSVWYIALYLTDLKRAIEFYEKTLGLTKKHEYSSYAGFQCGGVEIGLVPKEKVEISANAPTVEFIVDSVDQFCEALMKKGINIVSPPHDEAWGIRQMSLKDPDGNVPEAVQLNWERYFSVAAEGAMKK